MAGYSKTPLVQKLGLKAGQKAVVLNAPRGYRQTLGALPEGASVVESLSSESEFIHLFTTERGELEGKFAGLKRKLAPHGTLWISWPKGAAKMETDLNENIVREIGLKNGLVDVKVCAVDEVWSGLKFVYRLKDRV